MLDAAIREQIDPDAHYSVSMIARITGIHPNTIRNNLKDKHLKGEKGAFSRRWRVVGRDLLVEWLEKR